MTIKKSLELHKEIRILRLQIIHLCESISSSLKVHLKINKITSHFLFFSFIYNSRSIMFNLEINIFKSK